MAFKHYFFLFFFLAINIAQAAVNSSSSIPPTSKAFMLDTKIWRSNTIPICWENYAEIMANPIWKPRKTNLITYLNSDSWGAVTKLNFLDTNKQCPAVSTGFYGVRVLVKTNRPIYLPTKNKYLNTPYTVGLGADLNNFPNGVVLDFDIKPSIYDACNFVYLPFHPISRETCFKTTVIHEFGHVIGISHEQNRNDATVPTLGCLTISGLNEKRDPPTSPAPYNKVLIGNIKIGNYDTNSIMNYCNFTYTSQLTLTPTDKIAAQIYYGNMPIWNTPVGFNYYVGNGTQTVRIPSLKIGTIYYSATLTQIDSNNDGKYDVFKLVKTPLPNNLNISSYPVTVVNNVMNITMAKRTVSSSLYPYPYGKVYYLGHWEFKAIPGTTDKWVATSNYGPYTQYPIKHQ